MKGSRHRRRAEREGFVLLLVLAMLALIAIIGVGFANYSGNQKIGAEARDEAFQDNDDGGAVLADLTVDQVVCDTTSLVSFLRGHSLCRDLWGNDRINNVRVSAAASLNVFTLDFTMSNVPLAPGAREFLLGRTVVFKQSAQLQSEHGLIVDYLPATGQVQVDPPLPSVPQPGDVVAILQRPFNGPGDRDLSNNQTLAYFPNVLAPPPQGIERTMPNPLFPPADLFFNFAFNGRHPETRLLPPVPPSVPLQAIGGFDEPWDMADLQNVFLAAVGTRDLNLDGIPETVVVLPSYYRPVDNTGADGVVGRLAALVPPDDDWSMAVGRMKLLRPRPIDQGLSIGPDGQAGTPDDVVLFAPGTDGVYGTRDDPALPLPKFLVWQNTVAGPRQVLIDPAATGGVLPPSNPQTPPIPVDVDNDGDGMLESIWVDAGLPIVTRPDGTRAKPLAAILVVDLDSKFNLNVHGNDNLADASTGLPYRPLDLNGDGVADVQFAFHSSNLGASPSEVNIGWALAGKDGLDNDLAGGIDDQDINEAAEQWYLLSGRVSAMNTPIPGRYGEQTATNLPAGGPQAGLTGPAANPVDDDNDALEWRRFGMPTRLTESPAGSGTYVPLASLDTAGAAVRRLFGIPDFDGNGRHQLRPWYLTRWGTIRNPDDTHEPALMQTPLDLWANLAENFNEGDEFDPYLSGPFDAPYNLTDLEWLLRGQDLGGTSISTRLRNLAPLSFLSPANPTLGMIRRRHFTTQSWDWADFGLMPDVWRDAPGRTLDARWNRQDFTSAYNGYFDQDGQDTNLDGVGEFDNGINLNPVPPAVALGRRLNLNMPIGDGLDNDGDGIVDELDEPVYFIDGIDNDNDGVMDLNDPDEHPPLNSSLGRYVTALNTQYPTLGLPVGVTPLDGRQWRVVQALELYHLLQQIALPGDQAQIALDPNLDLPQLAQLAANIVDFRDPDSEPTPMPAGIQDSFGNPIRGVEYPALVISETLIRINEDEDTTNLPDQGIIDAATPGQLFVEIYNPGHPNRPSITTEQLANYRIVLDIDENGNNLPDGPETGNPMPAVFTMPSGIPGEATAISGDQYVVLGTDLARQPPTSAFPLNAGIYVSLLGANLADVFSNSAAAPFLGEKINLDWKVFLQRLSGGTWDTIDQSSVKVWVMPEPMPQDPAAFQHIPNATIVGSVNELVSRERREPYRAEPNLLNSQLPAPIDPATGLTYPEPNDLLGGPAVRNHPVAGMGTVESHSLGSINWHSDVDDINGNKMDDDAIDLNGDGIQDPQLDTVPTVAWPPAPGAMPLSRGIGWDILPWLDRDYSTVGELLLVPGVAAQDITALFRNGGINGTQAGMAPTLRNDYWYLADAIEARTNYFSVAGAWPTTNPQIPLLWLSSPRALHRLLEFTEVPSRQKGYQVTTAPAGSENRRRRVPGKINLNTVQDPLVLAGLADHPLVDVNPTAAFNQWLEAPSPNTRNGPDGILGTPDDAPFIFGYDGADPADPTTTRRFSLLRADQLNAADPTAPIFTINDDFGTTDNSGNALPPAYFTGRTGDFRNPWFKQELLRKISGQVTGRSNVFAVWITIGYFEVLDEPKPDGVDNDGDGMDVNGDGVITANELIDEPDELLPRLGREVGSTTGQVVRHRVFYIVDRTRSVGFDPDLKDDVQQMVIYRSVIE